jgi:hypothetical protein
MANITPETNSAAPTKAQPHKTSPNNHHAKKAENPAWVANSTPERRGPKRFMQANKAVSPKKIPIRPETPSHSQALLAKEPQLPLCQAKAHKSALANNMRQRLKANAPKRCAGGAENKLENAQQPAAIRAMASGRISCPRFACG